MGVDKPIFQVVGGSYQSPPPPLGETLLLINPKNPGVIMKQLLHQNVILYKNQQLTLMYHYLCRNLPIKVGFANNT